MSERQPELVRLLHLASPALPVGAYSYSQGLEAAIESRIVRDAATAGAWIGDVLALSVASCEAPILMRMIAAWQSGDTAAATRWNDELLATRETSELRAETCQMGYSLRRLLRSLWGDEAAPLEAFDEISYPSAFAFACAHWAIEPRAALTAYLWSWCENQVIAAMKAVPLGQTDGQVLLVMLGERIPGAVDSACARADDELENFAPGLALASARHETQYSRLFRS
jgi:urease accessory protein